MFDYIRNKLIGDIEGKKFYKQMMRRVDSLPEDYRFAFHKIQKYMYLNGIGDITVFENLIDLFESSAADSRKVVDVIGNDVSKFCDEFMSTSVTYVETLKTKLNKEIMEKFSKEEH